MEEKIRINPASETVQSLPDMVTAVDGSFNWNYNRFYIVGIVIEGIKTYQKGTMGEYMKRYKRGGSLLALLLLVCCTAGLAVHASGNTGQQLRETGNAIDRLEEEQREQQQTLDDLERYQGNLSAELAELNRGLQEVSNDMTRLQGEIDETNDQIAQAEGQIAELTEQSEAQYKAMTARIQYIYENGEMTYITALLGAQSFADFLNRTTYIQEIHNYDREQLTLYQNTIAELARQQEGLETAKEELVAAQEELEAKKGEIDTLIARYNTQMAEANSQIASVQDAMAETEAELERQRAYEEELERRKAQEDARRLEEIRQQESELPSNSGTAAAVPATSSDVAMLAALIECEAGGESYEGKLAVGSVVMNRVASSHFPNTMIEVIYQSGQFSPVASGRFAQVLARGASKDCVQAANEVLAGTRTLNCLFFRRNNGTIQGIVIGNHVFY